VLDYFSNMCQLLALFRQVSNHQKPDGAPYSTFHID
jgi:hypothetical protein